MSSHLVPSSFLFLVNFLTYIQCQADIIAYDVRNAVPFNGSALTNTSTGCNFVGALEVLECGSGTKLDDTITGPVDSVFDDLGSFFAFSRQSAGSQLDFTLQSATSGNVHVVLHFFNSPAESIGLPSISLRTTGPISVDYTFADNSDLSQTDSTIRNVTLVINNPSISFLDMRFTFTDDNEINWFLVSEVDIFDNTPAAPAPDSIVFQDGSSSVLSLGPDNPQSAINISCTVVNSGSFEWRRWEYNGMQLTSNDSRYQELIVDATRTSILLINESRYSDSGNYTCSVKHESDTQYYNKSNWLQLNARLMADSTNVSVSSGETASLVCELYGYLPVDTNIQWKRNGELIGILARHSITTSGGTRDSINNNGSPSSSIMSTLMITDTSEESDNGVPYTCSNNEMMEEINISVMNTVTSSSSSATIPSSAVAGSDTSSSSTNGRSSTTGVPSLTTSSQGMTRSTSTKTSTSTQSSSPTVMASNVGGGSGDSSSLGVIIGVVIVILIVVVLVNIVIILIVIFTCRQRKMSNTRYNVTDFPNTVVHTKTTSSTDMEPFYSVITEKTPVIQPYHETDFISEGSNGSVKGSTPTPNNNGHSSPPTYSEIPLVLPRDPPPPPRHERLRTASSNMSASSVHPQKTSTNVISPSMLKDNPMYSSADNLVENNDYFKGSDFDIYAHPNLPPPVPEYHGTPDGSLYNGSVFSIDLNPTHFKSQENLDRGSESASPYLMPYSSIYSDPQPIIKDDVLEVTQSQISEIKELGIGQFGRVMLAHTIGISLKDLKLSNDESSISILVAVKRLGEEADEKDRQTFEKEIKFMAKLRHENVVRLLGICLNRQPFIMMEYMENGDLNQYLQKFEFTPGTEAPNYNGYLSVGVLVYMCLQVAAGMRYLASLNFVHRDVAARNCLVGQKYVIKIADFGMSRKLYDRNYYRVQGKAVLPIRWMSCECFYGRFSEVTDVWAFGVTMWEIFNFCKVQPYEELSDQEVIDNAIKGADTALLSQPHTCPEEVYQVMVKCWHHDPAQRAKFEDLHGYLSNIHAYSDMA